MLEQVFAGDRDQKQGDAKPLESVNESSAPGGRLTLLSRERSVQGCLRGFERKGTGPSIRANISATQLFVAVPSPEAVGGGAGFSRDMADSSGIQC